MQHPSSIRHIAVLEEQADSAMIMSVIVNTIIKSGYMKRNTGVRIRNTCHAAILASDFAITMSVIVFPVQPWQNNQVRVT